MTPDGFERFLPPVPDKKFDVKPPLMFRGVSARFFPLRANLDLLQHLCNEYLNAIPKEAGFFRAPFPYVYLVVLDYGQMGEEVMRTGWFSQVEVYFGIPVEWYKLVEGQYVFHDWGVITPYIFVNDQVSVPVGRMVFGYPKVLAKVEMTHSEWLKNPLSPTMLARISTTVFPKAFKGGKLQEKVFLEVEREALSNWRVPIDATCPNLPWMVAGNLAQTLGGFGRDAMWLAQSMRICQPVGPLSSPELVPEMLQRLVPAFAPGGEGFVCHPINLKQFRREDDPTKICYRSLTTGCIQTTALNGAGLLGENHVLLGDLTGAHTIRLYEHNTLPITRDLGLEVNRSWTSEGIQVDEFKPVLPFWINVDLKYDCGSNIAVQHEDGVWRNNAGLPYSIGQEPDPDYNNTVSTAIEAITGPFQFTDTTVRAIPLMAYKEKVQAFLDKVINASLLGPAFNEDGTPSPYVVRLAAWGGCDQAVDTGPALPTRFMYVFLTVSSFGGVISESNNVGNWAKYELSFMVPVKFQRKDIRESAPGAKTHEWETVGVGLVPAFNFADNCITAFSRFEIPGIWTGTAKFEAPESVWLGGSCSSYPRQSLLRVKFELLPALGAGQMAKMEPLIEISSEDPNDVYRIGPAKPWEWAQVLIKELDRKKAARQQYFDEFKVARALALQLLGSAGSFCTPLSLYTLKWFPEVADPDKTCYQSLVRVPRILTEIQDLTEINQTFDIRLYGYPGLNIVEELGLVAAQLREPAAGVVYLMQGLRPFCLRTNINEQNGERLLSRSGLAPWTIHPAAFRTTLCGDTCGVPIIADRAAERRQDQIDPSRTTDTMFQAFQRSLARPVNDLDKITVADARNAVEKLDPQIVIESILSREWSNFDPEARWRVGKKKLVERLNVLPLNSAIKPFAEIELFRQINNDLAANPGAVAAAITVKELWSDSRDFSWLDRGVVHAIRRAASEGRLKSLLGEIYKKRHSLGKTLDPRSAERDVSERYQDIFKRNLTGKGADDRWRGEVKEIMRQQKDFTILRMRMEGAVDLLAPIPILRVEGLKAAYAAINHGQSTRHWLREPDPADLVKSGQELLLSIGMISFKKVAGDPSTRNNLDPVARAQEVRLKELLRVLRGELKDEFARIKGIGRQLDRGLTHSAEASDLVKLARAKCEVQYEALLNKLSRAYQKPDFCIRRDAVCPSDRDRLFPKNLSWDPDWYYGEPIVLSDTLVPEEFRETGANNGSRSSRAGSPRADGRRSPK